MVLFKEEETEEQTMTGLQADLTAAKRKLTTIGQGLNDGKEQIFVPNKSSKQIWRVKSKLQRKGRASCFGSRNHAQNTHTG
eukprot:775432-Heterocapsa_arctica.AAC.1